MIEASARRGSLMLVDIAEWESAEARLRHMEAAMAGNAFASLIPLPGAPIRVTVIQPVA